MFERDMRAVVIGVGLMGGALAGALKQTGRFREVVGVDVDEAVLARAMQHGLIDRGEAEAPAAVAQADLVVLATPVRHIIRLLHDLAPHFKPGSLVIDIGSTKVQVVAAMDQLPPQVRAIGGHPMTGVATAGVDGADPVMFHDRVFVLTPTERSSDETIVWTQDLLHAIGASVIILDAARHDQNVALISHLPRFLPIPLLALATNSGDEMAMRLAAGGFRDKTSGAADNPSMWTDVALTNSENLLAAIRGLQAQLDALAQTIASGDEAAIRAMMQEAQVRWQKRFGS